MTDDELENEIGRVVREEYERVFLGIPGALLELIKTVVSGGLVGLGLVFWGLAIFWLIEHGKGLLDSGADWLQQPGRTSEFFRQDFLDWVQWSDTHPFTICLWVAGILLYVLVQITRPRMTDAHHEQVILEQRRRTRELLALMTPWAPTLRQAVSMSAKYIRVIGIWIFGLLASTIIGGLIAERLAPPYSDTVFVGLIFGAPAGAFSFACIRLWLAGSSPKNSK